MSQLVHGPEPPNNSLKSTSLLSRFLRGKNRANPASGPPRSFRSFGNRCEGGRTQGQASDLTQALGGSSTLIRYIVAQHIAAKQRPLHLSQRAELTFYLGFTLRSLETAS
jgi:hypothetical protein